MNTFEPTCTEPGRWGQAPRAEAPHAEVLAYLRHCDVCEYHAMLNLEENLSLDVLLRDACRDLDVEGVALRTVGAAGQTARSFRLRPSARPPRAHSVQDRFQFERNLAQACIAAFCIVVLWISLLAYQDEPEAATESPLAAAETLATETPLSTRMIVDKQEGRLYLSQTINDHEIGQFVPSGEGLYDDGQLTVAAPGLIPGSFLRVTNPANGISVAVKVVQETYEDWALFLSPRTADSLQLDGAALVFVEVLSEPRSNPAAFAP